eukprot:6743837-Prymnesium_polylepis.2
MATSVRRRSARQRPRHSNARALSLNACAVRASCARAACRSRLKVRVYSTAADPPTLFIFDASQAW